MIFLELCYSLRGGFDENQSVDRQCFGVSFYFSYIVVWTECATKGSRKSIHSHDTILTSLSTLITEDHQAREGKTRSFP